MRINRNINQYFDKMGPDDMRLLWSSMLDLKTRINSMEYLLGGKSDRSEDDVRKAIDLGMVGLYYDARAIDRFMSALEMEKLFCVEGKRPLSHDDIWDIIKKYHWLMDESEE